jgi:prolyl 4-hydroxylase
LASCWTSVKKWTPHASLTLLLEKADDLLKQRTVPEPSLEHSPSVIVAAGHKVEVLMHMRNPRLVVFGNFLSEVECDELIELARPQLGRSTTIDLTSGEGVVSDYRTSRGMFFARTGDPGQPELVRRIDERAAALMNWPVDRCESLQVLHYLQGEQYRPHHDYFNPHAPSTASRISRGGQRVGTLLMYLNTPGAGGGTSFPDVDLEVRAVRGQAVFFSYEHAGPESRTLHASLPVLQGEKWIATRWFRQYAL